MARRSIPEAQPTPENRRPPHLLHETVIAPAADHRSLGAQPIGHELEGGMAVVVESTDDARIDPAGNRQGIETAEHPVKKPARVVAQVIEDDRRIVDKHPVVLVLRIENAQRIALEPFPADVTQPAAMIGKVTHKGTDVILPARRIAQGVDFENRILKQPEFVEDIAGHRDDFHIAQGVGGRRRARRLSGETACSVPFAGARGGTSDPHSAVSTAIR